MSEHIARWVLLLQEFTFTVQTRKGIHHENADYLSQLWIQHEETELVNDFPDEQLFQLTASPDSRYADLYRYLLTLQCPEGMDVEQCTVFTPKVEPYQIQHRVLFKLLSNDRLCCCLKVMEVGQVIEAMHTKDVGGHYATKNTVSKILNAEYSWPSMFKEVHNYMQRCDNCQRTGRPTPTTRWPLVPIMPLGPFKNWKINFVGPIQPATKHSRRQYILVATDYATKMVEAEATRRDNAATVS